MKTPLFASLVLPLLLTQCVDPFFDDMNGPGPNRPYGSYGGGSYYRDDMRERGNDLNRSAYERGMQAGQNDAQARQSQNYNRHRSNFDYNTEAAYRDGYNQGYSQSSSRLGGGYGSPPPQQQANDPGYNQGYDYGLRDLTSGRQPDPTAHVGRYDPRYRSSFERGYYDGYNSRSNQNSMGGSGSLWFR